jgi:predicted AlkP superfamily pyrophosphatase or phosphodiesterase
MLIISFDAVGDTEFDRLLPYPAFSAFTKQASVFRGVSSVFVSNTYPIHTSVATGATPDVHGIISNVEAFPSPSPIWYTNENNIRVKTLWQAAAEKGITIAAVLWPVTAHSKTIAYNVPEVMARPGKSQLMTSLAAGSKWLQLKLFLRHRRLLSGVNQPQLDNFSTACMADILRKYKPGLALVHLTAYDTICHHYGRDSAELEEAFQSLDGHLATLLDAAGNDRDVIIFSDHAQLNVHTELRPNDDLARLGYLYREGDAYSPGESGCYMECCGGAAFFHAGTLLADRIMEIHDSFAKSEGFRRFLTDGEIKASGYTSAAFGFCPLEGYSYAEGAYTHKANHGYPLDMPGYEVFYLVRGCGLNAGSVTQGGSLLDIAPLVTRRLGLDMALE